MNTTLDNALIYDAFYQVVETIRHRDILGNNIELCRLYAHIVENPYLLLNAEYEAAKLNGEMNLFVMQRCGRIFRDMVDYVRVQLTLDFNNSMDHVCFGNWKFGGTLTTRDYQILESIIRKICDHALDHRQHNVADTSIHTYQSVDLVSVLSFLANRLDNMIRKTTTVDSSYLVMDQSGHDSFSFTNMKILASTFIRVAMCLFILKKDMLCTPDEKRKRRYTLIGDAYSRCVALGSLRLQSILVSYRYLRILPDGVVNPRGSMTSVEREVLENVVLLSVAL